jgi:hypothetical protein
MTAMLDHQRIANPEGYRLVAQGVGLDDMTVPDVTAFRLGASVADPLGRSRVLEVA